MLLIGKQFDQEKERLFHCQNGLCPLCGRALNEEISANHLDHDHSLVGPNAGRVRALLCIYCNALEGQILHKFVSSGLNSKGVNIADWLRNLTEYYEKDISQNRIHKQYVPDKANWFARLNKPEMIEELRAVNGQVDLKETKGSLIAKYRKALRLFLK